MKLIPNYISRIEGTAYSCLFKYKETIYGQGIVSAELRIRYVSFNCYKQIKENSKRIRRIN